MPITPTTSSRPWIKKAMPFENATRSFDYNDPQWRKLSKVFKSSHPLCSECHKKGLIKETECIDHIKAINDGGDPFSWDNLQALCSDCHRKKTNKEINNRK